MRIDTTTGALTSYTASPSLGSISGLAVDSYGAVWMCDRSHIVTVNSSSPISILVPSGQQCTNLGADSLGHVYIILLSTPGGDTIASQLNASIIGSVIATFRPSNHGSIITCDSSSNAYFILNGYNAPSSIAKLAANGTQVATYNLPGPVLSIDNSGTFAVYASSSTSGSSPQFDETY